MARKSVPGVSHLAPAFPAAPSTTPVVARPTPIKIKAPVKAQNGDDGNQAVDTSPAPISLTSMPKKPAGSTSGGGIPGGAPGYHGHP
jgi:hypothetical protein